MITEGTRVDSDKVLTEEEVGREISADIARSEGFVLINFGWKDLTRFNTIYQAAKENGRTLVISPKLAYLLYEMHINFPTEYPDPRTMPNLKVYLKREGDLLYSKADYDKYKMGYLHYHGRNIAQDDRNIVRVAERLGVGGNPDNPKNPLPPTSEGEPYDYKELYELATHHLDNGVRAYQIRQNPKQYVLMFSYWDANELFDLIPLDSNHKTRYISASTEPFSEEMEIDEAKMVHWLDFFKIDYDYEMKNEQKDICQKTRFRARLKNRTQRTNRKNNSRKNHPHPYKEPNLFVEMFGTKSNSAFLCSTDRSIIHVDGFNERSKDGKTGLVVALFTLVLSVFVAVSFLNRPAMPSAPSPQQLLTTAYYLKNNFSERISVTPYSSLRSQSLNPQVITS